MIQLGIQTCRAEDVLLTEVKHDHLCVPLYP